MRYATLLLFLCGLTVDARALLTGVKVVPDQITLGVGETTTVMAQGLAGCCSSFPWHVEFRASSSMANVRGLLESPNWTAVITVTGLAPGTTSIVSPFIGDGRWPLATINVVCRPEHPAVPLVAAVTTMPGQPVKLAVSVETLFGKGFAWYDGRDPGASLPLYGAGPEITYTPEVAGTHYVSVVVSGPCATTSTVEFRVDAVNPRRRAVR